MKTKFASLLVVIILATISSTAQKRITVEVPTDDISKNLDLKAVATAFGESKNLEEFEQRLNDNDNKISNLDLNNDGEIDYLRVIEKNDNNVHNIAIQAVLAKDKYQDVATIKVEKDRDNNSKVEIAGDPFLYGENYIIEPVYLYTPFIFSYLWSPGYYGWYSPYYWGYFPPYFHHRRVLLGGMYRSHIYKHFGHAIHYSPSNLNRVSRGSGVRSSMQRNSSGGSRQSFNVRSMGGGRSGGSYGGRSGGGGSRRR
jgi:hypothetical protein